MSREISKEIDGNLVTWTVSENQAIISVALSDGLFVCEPSKETGKYYIVSRMSKHATYTNSRYFTKYIDEIAGIIEQIISIEERERKKYILEIEEKRKKRLELQRQEEERERQRQLELKRQEEERQRQLEIKRQEEKHQRQLELKQQEEERQRLLVLQIEERRKRNRLKMKIGLVFVVSILSFWFGNVISNLLDTRVYNQTQIEGIERGITDNSDVLVIRKSELTDLESTLFDMTMIIEEASGYDLLELLEEINTIEANIEIRQENIERMNEDIEEWNE